MLRADYRGIGKFTVYQAMGLFAIPYSFLVMFYSPQSTGQSADITAGIRLLWTPGMLVFFLLLWSSVFIYTGRSHVIGSTLSLYVHKERI